MPGRTTQQWFVLLVTLLSPVFGFSNESSDLPPDVRVVVDISGSMKTSDPKNLRRPAVDMVVELLPSNAKAGVWTFGKYVNMLVPHKPVSDEWKAQAKISSKSINSIALRSNIGGALEKAGYQSPADQGTRRQSIILLTDGYVDISRQESENIKEKERILKDLVPFFKKNKVKVHTIALSKEADQELLEKIAMETGGLSLVAQRPEDLLKIFAKTFDEAVPAEQVPLKDNVFLIDDSVEEFTLLAFNRPGSPAVKLMSPEQIMYDQEQHPEQIRWHSGQGYTLITMKNPQAGEWFMEAELDPDNRVTVVSNLKMKVDGLPNHLVMGGSKAFSVSFKGQEGTLSDTSFLKLIDLNRHIVDEFGRKKSLTLSSSNGGIFKDQISDLFELGYYEVQIIADGKTFQRQFKKTLLLVESITVIEEQSVDEQKGTVIVRPNMEGVDLKSSRVIAKIQDPSGRSLIQSLPLNQKKHWQLEMSGGQGPGRYEINLVIKGKMENQDVFELSPKPIVMTFPIKRDLREVAGLMSSTPVMPKPDPTLTPQVADNGLKQGQNDKSLNDVAAKGIEAEVIENPEVLATSEKLSEGEVQNKNADDSPKQEVEEIFLDEEGEPSAFDEEFEEASNDSYDDLDLEEDLESELESSGDSTLLILIIVGIVAGGVLAVGGWFFFKKKNAEDAVSNNKIGSKEKPQEPSLSDSSLQESGLSMEEGDLDNDEMSAFDAASEDQKEESLDIGENALDTSQTMESGDELSLDSGGVGINEDLGEGLLPGSNDDEEVTVGGDDDELNDVAASISEDSSDADNTDFNEEDILQDLMPDDQTSEETPLENVASEPLSEEGDEAAKGLLDDLSDDSSSDDNLEAVMSALDAVPAGDDDSSGETDSVDDLMDDLMKENGIERSEEDDKK